jgi:CRP-like cAMP-binding protein
MADIYRNEPDFLRDGKLADGHLLHVALTLYSGFERFKKGLCSAITRERRMFGSTPPVAVRNFLLATLPPKVLASIIPKLRHVSLPVRASLIVPGKTIEAVYFVESGWVSLVVGLEDGTQAEVGLVGREGMVGLPLILGIDTGFEDAFVQAPGTALQMEAAVFRQTLKENPVLQAQLCRYIEAMNALVTQTVACNGRHPLEQRFARRLLMAHDRAEGDDLPITQEFYPNGTAIAGNLQRAGIISRSRRGQITVLDRSALEATACDCYAAVQHRFSTLLGQIAGLHQ